MLNCRIPRYIAFTTCSSRCCSFCRRSSTTRPRHSSSGGTIHWLSVLQRITYKLCTLMHAVVNGQEPQYLMDMMSATVSSLRCHVIPTTAFVLSWSRSSTLGSITATSCLSDFLPLSAATTSADRTQRRSSLRRYDHVSDALAILHWLRLPERVNYKLTLMAYNRVLNGMAPPYLNQLVPVSSLPGRRRLRLSFTLQLHIPQYPLSTAGRRSFPVAASIFWNTLPDDVQSAPSVSSFQRYLKTFRLHQSFPDIIV